ncbi:MAG: glycosyltransferase family 2 protein [Bacteroidales bacterium]|nr:glycosyltransferase family 2 protein [Bacteroidales bacterium]
MSYTPVSAVVITFNEERNIARCIESLLPVSDEIVIVDSLSTDKTKEICLQYPVRFIEHPFEGYIEQKNWAMEQAKHDYILSLDADEALDEDLQKQILSIKRNIQYDAYRMNRLTNYCGRWIYHGGWYPDRKIRLWNKKKGKWGGINPHDKVMLSDNSKVKQLKGNILHYSYYTIDEHYRQIERFTKIKADAMFEKGIRVRFFRKYAAAFVKFLRNYLFRWGFLDGKEGLIIAYLSAGATFKKYHLLNKKWKTSRLLK